MLEIRKHTNPIQNIGIRGTYAKTELTAAARHLLEIRKHTNPIQNIGIRGTYAKTNMTAAARRREGGWGDGAECAAPYG